MALRSSPFSRWRQRPANNYRRRPRKQPPTDRRERYREGQEDQLSALGLVVNALILWTTRCMDAALDHLRATGADVKKEDLARLSPLSHKHFNMLGRYHFALPEEVLRGELRPLRIPEEADEELQAA